MLGFNAVNHDGKVDMSTLEVLSSALSSIDSIPLSSSSLVSSNQNLKDYLKSISTRLFNKILKEQSENESHEEIKTSSDNVILAHRVAYFNQLINSELVSYSDIIDYCNEHGLVLMKASQFRGEKWQDYFDRKFSFDTTEVSKEIMSEAKASVYVICHISQIEFEHLFNIDRLFSYVNTSDDFIHLINAFSSLVSKSTQYEKKNIEDKIVKTSSFTNKKDDLEPIYLYSVNSKKLPEHTDANACKNKKFRRL